MRWPASVAGRGLRWCARCSKPACREWPRPSETPTEEELLELLSEKARRGNVAAIRSLLARTDDTDPRQRALAAFEAIAGERRQ
jgi:hypothetical protein